jgi:osmotically-inducible protein OsmY
MTGLSTKERTLLNDVIDELSSDPSVDLHTIALAADSDIVALTGTALSYSAKLAAERAALRVRGVRGVVNDIVVTPKNAPPSDVQIAHAAETVLDWNPRIPKDAVRVIVRDGHVTLEGEVEWNYQRQSAIRGVGHLNGVRGVVNNVKVRSLTEQKVVKKKITEALHRNASLDASHVEVKCNDGIITLTGHVRSWTQREEVERAAWSSPGVQEVNTDIVIRDS